MRFSKRLVATMMAFVLCLASAPVPALAYGSQLAAVQPASSSSASLPGGVQLGDDEVEVTLHATLLQGGSFPDVAQAGSAWDGLETGDGALSGDAISLQAASPEDQLKASLLDAMERYDSTVSVGSYGYYLDSNGDCEALTDLYSSVVNAHPDLFYVATAYQVRCQRNGKITEVYPAYAYPRYQAQAMAESYEQGMADLLSWVPENATDAEKQKAVHDWLIQNCEYDETAASFGDPDLVGWSPWNAYGAVVEGSAVCQGYALAYRAAMNRLGIASTYIAANDHAWNCVVLDGSWYHVDATWDDHDSALPNGLEMVDDSYFLKSDAKVKALDEASSLGLVHVGWKDDIHAVSTKYDSTTDWQVYRGKSRTVAVETYAAGLKDSTQESAATPPRVLASSDVVLSGSTFTYTGSEIKPNVIVSHDGVELAAGTDYDVSFESNVNAGLASVTVAGVGDYSGTITKSFLITKAANPMKVKAQGKKVKLAKVRKKAQKLKALKFTRAAAGKVTYAKVSKGSSKRLSVNKKTGKVTVKKGTKAGSYKLKVKVKAAGTANYTAATKTVTVKVKVKS